MTGSVWVVITIITFVASAPSWAPIVWRAIADMREQIGEWIIDGLIDAICVVDDGD